MASKLRRPPLFGLDNPLGIPVLPKYSNSLSNSYKDSYKYSTASTQTSPTTTHPGLPPLPPRPHTLAHHKNVMEVGVASYSGGSPDRGLRGTPRANLRVEFAPTGEMKERKEKYLTAKYGAHQMSLI